VRLFVAIELDAQVLRAAEHLIQRLKRRAATLAPRARLGWVLPERMHLTVRFIGNVAAPQIDRLRDALAPPLDLLPFTLRVEGLGAFPDRGAPRVIWAGLTAGREAVLQLEGAITNRLEPIGIAPEDRPYSPHLTLARVREPDGLRSAPLVEGMANERLGTTEVSAVTLFESRLSPKGPTYVPLQRTVLGSR
jgi:2'-5' RNA ligase